MKALIVGDIHWSQYSSILRKRGEFYSQRLENLLWSVNWVEKQAVEHRVNEIIYLGDFFDRSDLNAEELTAFRDINWVKSIPHKFLVGNHELGQRTAEYSSIHFIESLGENFQVIDTPIQKVGIGYRFLFLPYIFESERKSLGDYWRETAPVDAGPTLNPEYVFSHNDLKMRYGAFESKEGFELADIESHCQYFINGHIHNHEWATKKVLNLGNLTGQNFNEDASKYAHRVAILDTGMETLSFIENPYAYNFYKLDLEESPVLPQLKSNAVLTVRCKESEVASLEAQLMEMESAGQVAAYRMIPVAEELDSIEVEAVVELNSVDHLKQFQEYVLDQLGTSEAVLRELQEVVK